MDTQNWRELRELFERALDLEGVEREALLRSLDAQRPELRAELERWLAAADRSQELLQRPAAAAVAETLDAALPEPGDRLGEFRLVRVLGSGGMGTVFEARQERPARTVALKVLQATLASASARARFEAEAEILARLRHPAIAQVYQSGVHRSAAGLELPWFAMEFVEGARDLSQWVREEAPDLEARLERFGELCAAVHHAHQKGVIHRDLKPANVLVDDAGRLKVIDYGVARVVDDASPGQTRTGLVLGTLTTMSPEQLSGGSLEVDARSDVYALGVVLYELVAGRGPYRVEGRSVTEVVELVCEREPPPPSQAGSEAGQELDWVVMRALAKDPARRYASAAELAADLERWRRGLPLLAGPDSRRYLLAKFVRRHRLAVGAAGAVVLALALGVVALTIAYFQVGEARAGEQAQLRQTRTALARQTAVIDTLAEIVAGVRPDEDGREVTLFELLERHRPALLADTQGDPALRAALLSFYTEAYFGLGQQEKAAELAEAALAADARSELPDAILATRMRRLLAALHMVENRTEEAEALVQAVEASADEGDNEEQLFALRSRAMLHGTRAEFAEAAELYGELVERARASLAPDHALIPTALAEQAEVTMFAGDLDAAEALGREALEIADREHGEDSLWSAVACMRLGVVEAQRGTYRPALEHAERAVDTFTRELGPAHTNTLQATEVLVRALGHLDRASEAEDLVRDALETCRSELGDAGLMFDVRLSNELALLLGRTGRVDEQREVLVDAVELLERHDQGDSFVAGELRDLLLSLDD